MASTHSLPKLQMESHTDKGAITLSAASLTKCFTEDPVMRWCLRQPDGRTLSDDEGFRRRYFNVMMAMAYGRNATFVNVDGEWKCVGVFFPPGTKPSQFGGLRLCWRDLLWCLWKAGWSTSQYVLFGHGHFVQQFHAAAFPERREIMEKGDYYNIYFLGTQVEARGQGLGSAFLKHVQQIAREAGKPIYLQSSTEKNRSLYEKHGFKVIKELVIGEDKVGRDGRSASEEKNGVVWWALTWWPEELQPTVS